MKDLELCEALCKIPSDDLPERARGFQADAKGNLRKYGHFTEKQRSWAISLVREHGDLPSVVVGEDGILSGPLPCGHDVSEVGKSQDGDKWFVFCRPCFETGK